MKIVTREYAFAPKKGEVQRKIFVVREDDLPNLPYSFSVYVEITEEEESSGVKFPDIVEFVKNSGVGIPKPKDILEERQETHGEFAWVAEVSQELKEYFRNREGWHSLSVIQREALDNIAQKTARIFAGDPNFADHWVDIEGYAKLAEKEIRKGENQDGPISSK